MNHKKSISSWVLALTVTGLAALLSGPSQALAMSILLPDAASFAVLGGAGVTSTLGTAITGNVGGGPVAVAVTGLIPAQVSGTLYLAGAPLLARAEVATAYGVLAFAVNPTTIVGGILDGLTLAPGVYSVAAATTNLTGTLTLDGGGNSNASWIFKMPTTLITGVGSSVVVQNAGSNASVFWQVGSSATLNTSTTFEGNILALASISMGDSVTINCGRALTLTASVTLINDRINNTGGCTGLGNSGLNGTSPVLIGNGGTAGGGTGIVPEPASLLLLGAGLAGIGIWRRRAGKN